MRQVAIVFTTTGPSPKDGHRIQELMAVELSDGIPRANKLHQTYKLSDQMGGRSFAEQFDELNTFIGDAHVIVHQGNAWRKFMRTELRTIKSKTARRLLRDVVDVAEWAHTRFPKQRKDLASLARKIGRVPPDGAAGPGRDLQILAELASAIHQARILQPIAPEVKLAEAVHTSAEHVGIRPSLKERLKRYWNVLVGHA
jgi:hypothetical protein